MMNLDQRRQIASKLQALSTTGVEFNEVQRYISLAVGTAPYKNAITVSKVQDRISFYIENLSFLDEVRKRGFRLGSADQKYLYNKDRYWLYEVAPSDVDSHPNLFGSLAAEAIRFMQYRRSKKS
jgi:hypothetical protein